MGLGSKPLKRGIGWLVLVVSEGSLMKLVKCYKNWQLDPATATGRYWSCPDEKVLLEWHSQNSRKEGHREQRRKSKSFPPSPALYCPLSASRREQLAVQKCDLQESQTPGSQRINKTDFKVRDNWQNTFCSKVI